MLDLTKKRCVPCEGGLPPLSATEVHKYLKEVPGWTVADDNKSISRIYKFKDFKEAMAFVNEVADIAEFESHHPDISIHYNKVTLTLATHAIGGLSENDFILAAKIDEIKN